MHPDLERMGRHTLWSAFGSYAHQRAIDRLRSSVVGSQLHLSSVWFGFPVGSFTCPDIALLSEAPSPQEGEHPLERVPEAVIEVISEGYEAKDLEVGPHCYLS